MLALVHGHVDGIAVARTHPHPPPGNEVEARKQAVGAEADPSLLERILTALRNAARPASRPSTGMA